MQSTCIRTNTGSLTARSKDVDVRSFVRYCQIAGQFAILTIFPPLNSPVKSSPLGSGELIYLCHMGFFRIYIHIKFWNREVWAILVCFFPRLFYLFWMPQIFIWILELLYQFCKKHQLEFWQGLQWIVNHFGKYCLLNSIVFQSIYLDPL